jgi:hypothetical protein
MQQAADADTGLGTEWAWLTLVHPDAHDYVCVGDVLTQRAHVTLMFAMYDLTCVHIGRAVRVLEQGRTVPINCRYVMWLQLDAGKHRRRGRYVPATALHQALVKNMDGQTVDVPKCALMPDRFAWFGCVHVCMP